MKTERWQPQSSPMEGRGKISRLVEEVVGASRAGRVRAILLVVVEDDGRGGKVGGGIVTGAADLQVVAEKGYQFLLSAEQGLRKKKERVQ